MTTYILSIFIYFYLKIDCTRFNNLKCCKTKIKTKSKPVQIKKNKNKILKKNYIKLKLKYKRRM